MDIWYLLFPAIIYCGFVAGIVVFWAKKYRKEQKWTSNDDRALQDWLKEHSD